MPDYELTARIRVIADEALGKIKYFKASVSEAGEKAKLSSIDMMALGMGLERLGSMAGSATDSMTTAFADFDQAMANTISITQGTRAEMNEMRSQALELAKTMPYSSKEIAEGYYYLASAGKSANEILQITPGILKLATATGADFTSTANLTTAVLDVYGEKAGGLNNVMEVLMNTVKGFKTTLPELADTMRYALAPAAQAGIKFQELTYATGLLRNAGLEATQAGTGLRQMLSSLLAPTDSAREIMDKYGFQVIKNADGTLNLSATMQSLKKHILDVLPPTERAAVLNEMFGDRGQIAASVLGQMSEELAANADELTKTGSVADAFSVQMQGTANQLQLARNEMETAKIEMGKALAPAEIFLARTTANLFTEFSKLPAPIQTSVGVVMLMTKTVGEVIAPLVMMAPALQALGISGKIAAAGQWLWNTSLYGCPIVWIIAAIVALIAVIALLVTHYEDVAKAVGAAWDTMKDWGGAVAKALEDLWKSFTGFFSDLAGKIYNWGRELIQNFIDGIMDMFGAVGDAVSGIGDQIKKFLGFSLPEMGPLREVPIWGKHLAEEFVRGMEKSMPDVSAKIEHLISGGPPAAPAGGTTLNVQPTINVVSQPFDVSDPEFASYIADIVAEEIARRAGL